jgi:hypothetical protein
MSLKRCLSQSRSADRLLLPMQNELDIVRDVSQRLDRAGITYMLTGSRAMNYYAQPRMSTTSIWS